MFLYSLGPACNMQSNCSWDQIPLSPHSCKDLQRPEVLKAIILSAKLVLALTNNTFTGASGWERRGNSSGVTWRGALSMALWDFTTNQQVWADRRALDSSSLLKPVQDGKMVLHFLLNSSHTSPVCQGKFGTYFGTWHSQRLSAHTLPQLPEGSAQSQPSQASPALPLDLCTAKGSQSSTD